MVPVYRFALWLWLKRCEILGPRPQGCVRKTKPSGVRDRVCSASNNDDVKNQLFSKASFNQCGMCKNCKCEWNFVLLLLSESKKLLAKSLLLAWSVCVHKKKSKIASATTSTECLRSADTRLVGVGKSIRRKL